MEHLSKAAFGLGKAENNFRETSGIIIQIPSCSLKETGTGGLNF